MLVQEAFVKRPISVAVQVAIYSIFLATSVQAAPTGGQVVGGSGSISQSGATTTINQASQNMAINWQSYNVNSNETVNYKQPNASSISLNRILSNDGSTIAGHINANGQVILVNPNGILFTPTAVINVGGIIASGMDMSPSDFMNGKYMFNAIDGKNGTVVNTGTINASLGGNVALVGKKVENDGLIAAKLGTVSLAAGKQAVLTFDNGGVLGVRVSKAVLQKDIGVDPAVLNKGKINAAGGRVLLTASTSQDVFSQAVNSGNIQQATSVVVNADGSFSLGEGADTVNTGIIDTSVNGASQSGGQIVMLGNNVTSSGTLKADAADAADAADGNGGNIELHSTDTTLLTQDSLTSARSENAGTGGIVKVLGDKVGLFDQSTVDVSGANGGGQALIGGDEHGANAYIQNANKTIVGQNANIYADALDQGNGGKVIVWSDTDTLFFGNIYTRGGAISGDGGFVETSSGKTLLFDGSADRRAVNGKNGTLLLDPLDITINNSTNDAFRHDDNRLLPLTSSNETVDFSTDPTSTVTITKARLIDALGLGDVTLDARRDIYIDGIVDMSGSGSVSNLTLQAGDDVVVNDLINLDKGNLLITSGVIDCGADGCTSSGSVSGVAGNSIEINAPLYTTGTVTLNSGDNITLNDNIGNSSYRPSLVSAYAGNDITSSSSGNITTHGSVTLFSADAGLYPGATQQPSLTVAGDINLSGSITTHGGAFTATAGDSSSNVGSFVSTSSIDTNINGGAIDITTYGNNGTYGQYYGSITGRTFTANAYNGQISQNAVTIPGLNISGNATINAYGARIYLNNTSNDVAGVVSLSTTQGTIANPNSSNAITFANAASTTKLGDVSAAGPLTIYTMDNLELTKNVAVTDVNNTSAGTFTFGASNASSTFTLDPGVSLTNTNTAAGSLTVTGGTGNDTFSLGGLFNGTLNTGGGADILKAPNPGSSNQNIWSIAGNDAGTLTQSTPTGTINFSQFARLVGGANTVDQFNVTGDTQGELQLDGGGGGDSLSFASSGFASPIYVTLTNGLPALTNAPNIVNVNQFSTDNIGVITNNNTMVAAAMKGPDIFANWSIQPTASVSWNGQAPINFTGFGTVQGGASGNSFNIYSNDPSEPMTINAGSAGDTFKLLSDYSGALNGGTGNDRFYISLAGITVPNIVGGGGNDKIFAPNGVANTWSVTGTNSGTLTNTAGLVTFKDVSSLNGGNAGNTFTLAGGTIGTINGGGTTGNEIDGPGATTYWTLTGKGAGTVGTAKLGSDLVAQFTNIQTLKGAAGNTNSLQGSNTTSTTNWYISGTDSGSLDYSSTTMSFLNFQNITGGDGTNNFYFGPNNVAPSPFTTTGSLSGTLDGGIGSNNSLYARSGAGVPTNVWTFTDTVNHVASSTNASTPYVNFIDIQHNNAGTSSDTANVASLSSNTISAASYNGFASLTGASRQALAGSDNLDTTWHIFAQTAGQNTGTVTVAGYPLLNFTGFGSLVGSNKTNNSTVTNTFIFDPNGVFVGNLTGGLNANNVLNGLVLTANTWKINATNGGTLNTQTTFANMQKLVGGNVADNFDMAAIFNGQIDGGSGANSLKTDTGTDAWTVNGLNQGSVYDTTIPANKTAFTGISYLYGGSVSNSGNQNDFQFTATGQLQNTSNGAPGMIYVSHGNSSVTLGMTGQASAGWQLDYIGNTGSTNTLTVNNVGIGNANLAYNASYAVTDTDTTNANTKVNTGNYRQLAYTPSAGGAQSVSVNYRNLNASDKVTSNEAVNTLAVNGVATSPMTLLSGQFQVGANTPVTYSKVQNLTANAVAGEAISLNDNLDFGAGDLTLNNGAITQQSGTSITANALNLNNVSLASGTSTLSTDIGSLSMTAGQGPMSITQVNTKPLTLSGLNTSQALTITADAGVTNNGAALTSTGPLTITATNGAINLTGANLLSGEVSLSGTTVSLYDNDSLLLGDISATGDLTITGQKNITQAAGTAIDDSAGLPTTTINTSGGDIALNNPNNSFGILNVSGSDTISLNSNSTLYLDLVKAPNSVSLTTQGGIWNQVGGTTTNIQSNSVILSAKAGIGDGSVSYDSANQTITPTVNNAVNLDTANLSAVNLSAARSSYAVVLTNDKSVTITDLRNNGDIYFNNTGDINLAVAPKVSTTNPGAIDANYNGNYDAGSGRYTDKTYAGNVALVGTGTNSVYALEKGNAEADITAENLLALSFNQFGTKDYPVRLDVHNQFSLYAGVGSIAYPFDNHPANITTDADLTVYSGINSLSGEQIIDIESLGDVDPAIFTAVRNYDHEDVAILLPPDQRLGDDQDCTDNNKKCKKRHQAVN